MRIFAKWGRFFINFSHFILPIQIFFVPLHQVKQITIEIMKKVLWLIVCLMTMVLSVNAQDYKDVKYHKIKEAAVKAFKSNLIAPSKFILANSNGE